MWLSSTAQQAVHAVLCIAASAEHGPVRADEIALAIDCPRNYLSKTLHALVRAGVLRSARGPKGGFQLAHRPGETTLAQVIAPFEPLGERRCLLGRPRCGDEDRCVLHDRWARVAAPVDAFLAKTTIANLLGGSSRASDATREAIGLMRPPPRSSPHGSVAR